MDHAAGSFRGSKGGQNVELFYAEDRNTRRFNAEVLRHRDNLILYIIIVTHGLLILVSAYSE